MEGGLLWLDEPRTSFIGSSQPSFDHESKNLVCTPPHMVQCGGLDSADPFLISIGRTTRSHDVSMPRAL